LHQEPGERCNDRSNNKPFKQRSFGSRSQSRSPSRYQKEARTVNKVEISSLKDATLHDDIPIPADEESCKYLWVVGRTEMLRLSKEVRAWENETRKCGENHTLKNLCWRCGGDRKTLKHLIAEQKKCQLCRDPLDDHKRKTVAGCGKFPQSEETRGRINCGE
jgi:hypothetical protein